MDILADECVDRQIVIRLRDEGHEVIYIAELGPSASDDIVLEKANEKHALLLTADKDFGELVFRLGKINAGVLFFRLAGLSQEDKAEMISSAIRDHSDEIRNAFTVVTPGIVRIRKERRS